VYPGELDPACNYIHTPYESFRKADVYAGLVNLPMGPGPTMADNRRRSKGRGGKGYRGRKPVTAF
jgi:hypothetical protein